MLTEHTPDIAALTLGPSNHNPEVVLVLQDLQILIRGVEPEGRQASGPTGP